MLYAIQYLPFTVAEAVLCGIALAGWRRTHATGALLIAIAAAVQILYGAVGVWSTWAMLRGAGGMSMSSIMALSSGVQMVGHLIAMVLFIVGVALLIKRVTPIQRR